MTDSRPTRAFPGAPRRPARSLEPRRPACLSGTRQTPPRAGTRLCRVADAPFSRPTSIGSSRGRRRGPSSSARRPRRTAVRALAGALRAVIESGTLRLLGDASVDLPIEGARRGQALAARRQRIAWDSSGSAPRPAATRAVDSSSPGGTYWLTTDVTDGADAGAVTRWQSHVHLTAAQALDPARRARASRASSGRASSRLSAASHGRGGLTGWQAASRPGSSMISRASGAARDGPRARFATRAARLRILWDGEPAAVRRSVCYGPGAVAAGRAGGQATARAGYGHRWPRDALEARLRKS